MLRQGKAKPVVFHVASRFKNVVQSTRFKRSPYTIRTWARSETLQKALIKQVQRQVAKECKLICSIKGGESVLRYKPPRLLNFKWKLIASELKKKAPTLYAILTAACTRDGKDPPTMILSMAASVLLKARNKCLCLPQSVVLYAGHYSKMVSFCCDC